MVTPKRVAVSGAGGFVGRELLSSLVARGSSVSIIRRVDFSAAFDNESKLSPCSSQVLNDCDAVVHLAARAHVLKETTAEPLALYRASNRDATLDLARAAAAAGVRRFVFVSSIRVNGGASKRPITCGDAVAPQEPYAISKHEAEQGLWEVSRETGLEVVIVRPPLVYGPKVKANFLRLLKLSASGLPLPLGSVSGMRSLVSIWNLCDLLVRCVEHPPAPGHTFLAADGEDIALPDLIRALAAGMGRPCRVFPAPPALVRLGAAAVGKVATFDKLTASLQIDISKTRRILDWTPPVPLHEGLARTAHWYAEEALARAVPPVV